MSDENLLPTPIPPEGAGELVLYRTEDGRTRVSCRFEDGSVWLTQAAMADLFQTTPQNITLHVAAIYGDGELQEEATCKQSLQVRQEGSRKVGRHLKHYNLNMILAVGYWVRSPRGTQFRQWATARLEEYLVKGFTLDDERLKQAGGGDYFDELIARIRDIRSSERVFWRKVLDIYATSVDYDPRAEASQQFFKVVQNKMHWAAHGQTAAGGCSSRRGDRTGHQAAHCRQEQDETAQADGIGADSPMPQLSRSNGREPVTHRSPREVMHEIAALDAESADMLRTIRGLQ